MLMVPVAVRVLAIKNVGMVVPNLDLLGAFDEFDPFRGVDDD